jgi:uncharacterized protein (TIGR03435 family)
MRTITIGILWVSLAAAQATFEVASVKPSAPDIPGMFTRFPPDGSLHIQGATLRNLVSIAYGVYAFQVTGGPKWIDTDRFDVEARAVVPDGNTPVDPAKTKEELRKRNERFRSLLAERFQLTVHSDTKEQPVYALAVAKGGPKLQESTETASFIRRMGPGHLKGQAAGITMLVVNLSNELGRRVINKTAMDGKYSFDLTWTTFRPSTGQPTGVDPEAPSIFTALQEQLGLRLESDKAPVEVLVIDRAEKPSVN